MNRDTTERARPGMRIHGSNWSASEEMGRPVSVRVVARTASNIILVDWSDATSCRYGEQVWREARAECCGTCALSGLAVRKGDAIYRPRLRHPPPLNADAMIRADQIVLTDLDQAT